MAWTEFIIAWGVFFLTHSVPIRPPLRPLLEQVLGLRVFLIAYSTLSLGTLGWLIGAAGRAPYVPLWDWAPWQNTIPLVAMLMVCIILSISIGRPNPFSFGGARNDQFDPTHAGIVRITRHPLLSALALWAAAHIVPNGDLAHVLLFGLFALFAALGGQLVNKRKQREIGEEWHQTLGLVTAHYSNAKPVSWPGTFARIFIGIVAYLGLTGLHPWLFGVSPLG